MADDSPDPTPVDNVLTPDPPKASWIWMKDSAGYPSVTVTFVTVAFWVTTLWFIASIFQKIGPIELRQFDPAAATAYLGPALALYFSRKMTDAKYGVNTTKK